VEVLRVIIGNSVSYSFPNFGKSFKGRLEIGSNLHPFEKKHYLGLSEGGEMGLLGGRGKKARK